MNSKDTVAGNRLPDSEQSSFFQELLATGLYKRSQGRLVRQITCLAIWLVVGVAVWRFQQFYLAKNVARWLGEDKQSLSYLLTVALGALGAWAGYRLVNWPKFADFLISVEAELYKVSWPTQREMIKASMVVIFTIMFMSAILFLYDAVWRLLFQTLGIA
ncbi:MAG: preprotein translocase subunit SecE [Pirellulaceae bacterium]|nr:preprotein translocase subunit SecE [Pirellulaceae bacterium]